MIATKQAPNTHPLNFKRTKMIVTIGPSTEGFEKILSMIKAGANGIRLNFSHGTHEWHEQQIKWIRKASKEYDKPVAIIQDLQGPKIRLGDFEGIITVQKDQELRFKHKADYDRSKLIPVQYDIAKKVKRGERLILSDGRINTVITAVTNGVVHARAENEGILIKRKGMNLPDTDFGGDIITAKDKEDLIFGCSQGVDYVALSFVQTDQDIYKLMTELKNIGSRAKVIAKIETKSAIENIEKIFQATDAVMIARGDLATETSPESIPVLQRQIIGYGLKYKKPTIVATQMLASMTEVAEPTRAEISDIATAVIVGADAVMLSDETAVGKYPIKSVQVMKRVIMYTQDNSPLIAKFEKQEEDTKQDAICHAVVKLSQLLKASAIVAETKSGSTALAITELRPHIPVITVTSDHYVARQLAIVYGIKSYIRPDHRLAAQKLTDWLKFHKVLKKGDMVITASGRYPGVVGTTDTIKVRVIE